jgi:hypothetical protein
VEEQDPRVVEIDGVELHLEPIEDEQHTGLPPRLESWRRRSAMGAIMSGIALGLKEALEPEKDEPAIVVQVSGEPIGERPVEAQLDDRTPKDSVVTIRPWLLPEGEDASALAAPVGALPSWLAPPPPAPAPAPEMARIEPLVLPEPPRAAAPKSPPPLAPEPPAATTPSRPAPAVPERPAATTRSNPAPAVPEPPAATTPSDPAPVVPERPVRPAPAQPSWAPRAEAVEPSPAAAPTPRPARPEPDRLVTPTGSIARTSGTANRPIPRSRPAAKPPEAEPDAPRRRIAPPKPVDPAAETSSPAPDDADPVAETRPAWVPRALRNR